MSPCAAFVEAPQAVAARRGAGTSLAVLHLVEVGRLEARELGARAALFVADDCGRSATSRAIPLASVPPDRRDGPVRFWAWCASDQ